jgi:hypothetical protein
MKPIFTLFLAVFSLSLAAQFSQLSYGSGYQNQVFYDLETRETQKVSHDAYDIYVSTGPGSAAIYVNEGVNRSMSNPQAELELYVTASTDFTDVDTANMQRIHNDEEVLGQGAFNVVGDSGAPFDLGWGKYKPNNNIVEGEVIYVIRLRDGSYHKIYVESLISGEYTIQTAPLGSTDSNEIRVSKSDFSGPYAFISLSDGTTHDFASGSWDLWFTRYTTPLDDGTGNILQYVVTGVLLHPDLEAVKADGVDPETADWADYISDLTNQPNAIGHDWKDIDLGTFTWEVFDDLVYFIETPDNEIWQLQFIDFEGSSTGVVTLRSENVGMTSSVSASFSEEPSLQLYPNPVTADGFSVRSSKDPGQYHMEIFTAHGKIIEAHKTKLYPENPVSFTKPQSSGMYYLRWTQGDISGVIPFVVP